MSETSRLWDKAAKCRRTLAHTSDIQARTELVKTIKDLEHRASQSLTEQRDARSLAEREFYVGKTGDRWLIDISTDQLRIIHRPAAAQDGEGDDMSFMTFLDGHGPESPPHQALMHFLSGMLLQLPA